jgi:hypothetical protein
MIVKAELKCFRRAMVNLTLPSVISSISLTTEGE